MGEEETPKLSRKQESGEIVSTINDLPADVLLWDIFRRLESPRDIRRCIVVCRCWKSLIHSPGFYYHPGFALIVNIPAPIQSLEEPHYATDERTFNDWEGFKLKYLPCFNTRYKHPVCVQASFSDLLLCTESYKTQAVFYIVNPYTIQWTRLPKTPSRCPNLTLPVGLIAKLEGIPAKYRYKVVRMTCIHRACFRFEEFDSDTCCWSVKFIGHPPSKPPNWRRLTHYQGVACNGALHWLAKDGPILAYDPFDIRNTCKFISRDQGMCHSRYENATVAECLTISRRHLWVVQLVFFPTGGFHGDETHHVCVWQLEDYEKCKWVIKYWLFFKHMVCDVPWLRDYMHEFIQKHTEYTMTQVNKFYARFHTFDTNRHPENIEVIHSPEPLACDPSLPNIVYLYLPYSIVRCDILTRQLKIVSKIRTQLESYYYDTVVPTAFQWQPTPVPRFTEVQLDQSSLPQNDACPSLF